MKKMYTYLMCDGGGASDLQFPFVRKIGEEFYCEYGKYEVREYSENYVICERIYSEFELRKFSDDKKKIFDIINKSPIRNDEWQAYLHELSNDLYRLDE